MAQTTHRVMVAPGRLRGVGLVDGAAAPSTTFNDANPPWRLRTGESYLDNIPTSATIVDVKDYTTSRDIYSILNQLDKLSTPTGAIYVRFQAGNYYLNSLQNYGTSTAPSWLGYANSNRKIMGLIGAGIDPIQGPVTHFVTDGGMINNSPDNCRSFLLDTSKVTSPDGVKATALYFSNTGTSTPLFFSGISFDGNLQGPYGVFTPTAQGAFRRNNGASSPLPFNGMSLWRSVPGARFQYSRFRGWGFALNSAPPFECGMAATNYCNMYWKSVEFDGRISPDIDPTQPRAGGGLMWNKELDSTMDRVWMHHTRRSGPAANTNTRLQTEKYTVVDSQFTDIANLDASDPWPSDVASLPGNFNTPNVEEVLGVYRLDNIYMNSTTHHLNWAVPFSNSNGTNFVPDHVTIIVNGFKTDDSKFGGCYRFYVHKQPNSTGPSPVWAFINTNFATNTAALISVRKDYNGVPLSPVKESLFNPSVHLPSTHFVMEGF